MTSLPELLVTGLMDGSARPAAVTLSHAEAMERAYTCAVATPPHVELVELAIAAPAFAALRRALTLPPTRVVIYDLFPIARGMDSQTRRVAGQFLAAEALWAMEEQGLLGGVAAQERFDFPDGWPRDPRAVQQRLQDAGATRLSDEEIKAFQATKAKWDQVVDSIGR